MNVEYSRDKFYYPFTLTSATVKVNGTEVSLTNGTYYAHNDSTLDATYPSFYIMLRARLAAVIGGTWTVEAIAPPGYPCRSGIRLRRASGSFTGLQLADTTALVRALLGFARTDTATKTPSGGILDGEYSGAGIWAPMSCFDGRASLKDQTTDRVTAWSTPHPEIATAIVWRERITRILRYDLVYGASVFAGRNAYADLTAYASRLTGDVENTLDTLWAEMGRDLPTVLVSYDTSDLDLELATRSWEAVKLSTSRAAESLSQVVRRKEVAADWWTVELPLTVIGGSYGL